ncbi:MAG: hypothetical protein IJS17_03085 [Clostridia bacterium]|nr:hypothetical protein [Clostridia bacterium]
MAFYNILLKVIQSILSLILSLIIPTLPAASVIGFGGYEPIMATQREYKFDIDRLNIGGYGYNLRYSDEEHFAQIKEAGLDFLVTDVNDALLDYCDENGIGIIAHGLNANGGWIWDFDPNPVLNLTKESFKNRPCLWGDGIIDEPCTSVYDNVAKAVDHYYSLDTKTVPLVNLLPYYLNEEQAGFPYENLTEFQEEVQVRTRATDFRTKFVPIATYENEELYNKFATANYSTNKMLALYKKYVSMYISKVDTDIVCVDIYPLSTNDTSGAYWLNNLDILAEACRATGRKLWVITQACGGDAYEARYCDNPEDIRYQMYISLSFGAKSIIHACYSSGWWDNEAWLVNKKGKKTDTYYAVQKVNKEVSSFADLYANYDNIGTFFKNGHGADATNYYAYLTPISREDRGCVIDSEDHILAGCFKAKDGNSRAYTFVNINGKYIGSNAYLNVTFDEGEKITVYQKGVATVVEGNTLSLKLDCEEGVFVTVE